MAETKLNYLDDSYLFEINATITAVIQNADNTDVQLDETIFYPQGGGQPSDKGMIKTNDAEFEVEEVRFENGIVHHYGHTLNGLLKAGDKANLQLNKERRILNMRNHTAGHLVASAMSEVNSKLKPIKGYHFPDGPYVQFEGTVTPEERPDLLNRLQEKVNLMISEQRKVIVRFVPYEELAKVCRLVPDNIPKDKPSRIVTIDGSISVPDGGTTVKNVSEIGTLLITKIKAKGSDTLVSYKVG